MSTQLQSLFDAALLLPELERGELAARLLDSLDSEADEGADSEWTEEIRNRIEDVRTGKVQTVPWTAAREQIMDDADGDR